MARVRILEPLVDAQGNVRAGETYRVYNPGTVVDAPVWTLETGGVSTAGPRLTNSRGEIDGWIDEGGYDLLFGTDVTVHRRNYVDAERSIGARAVFAAEVFS